MTMTIRELIHRLVALEREHGAVGAMEVWLSGYGPVNEDRGIASVDVSEVDGVKYVSIDPPEGDV